MGRKGKTAEDLEVEANLRNSEKSQRAMEGILRDAQTPELGFKSEAKRKREAKKKRRKAQAQVG